MIKKLLLVGVSLFLLVSCAPKEKEEVPEGENEQSVVVGDRDGYSIITPYTPSDLRQRYASGYREIDTIEIGRRLQDLSKPYFSTKTYKISEGSAIDATRYDELTRRRSDSNPYGLNPQRSDTAYVSEVYDNDGTLTKSVSIKDPVFVHSLYEVNFHKKADKSTIDAMSVAVILERQQTVSEGVTHNLSDEELYNVANEMIGVQLLAYLRRISGLEEVPIMIAFYVQDSVEDNLAGRYLPGKYIASGISETGKDTLSLNKNNEGWILLNSDAASTQLPQAYSNFLVFKRAIADFMADENIGVVGRVFVVDGKIQRYHIEVNTGSKTQLELYGLTQFMSGELKNLNSAETPVTVDVKVFQNTRAVVDVQPGETPDVTFMY